MRSVLFFGLLSLAVTRKTFHGDQVLTVHLENESQVKAIKDLETKVDFWKPDSPYVLKPGMDADFRVPSEILPSVKVKIENVEEAVQAEMESRDARGIVGGNSQSYDYDVYHTYEEIMQWTDDIASQYSDVVTKSSIGKSCEGRDLPMLTLSTSEDNPRILIDCGIHAREWIAPAYCQCLVNTLLNGGEYGLSINEATYHIIPLLNPDGYAYTWASNRMWRKTRSRYSTICYGVDPNRNFDAGWAGPGSSSDPCSETYYGPSMASEPEVQALTAYVEGNATKLKMYITFHSYGQVVIYPYSYQRKAAANDDVLGEIAQKGVAAAKSVNRKTYTYGPGYDSMYLAAGGSDDFTYDQGVRVVYTIELRDNGLNGFLLPENQIKPQCDEMNAFMKVLQDAANNTDYYKEPL